MLRLVVRSEIPLLPEDLERGLVMWIDASIHDSETSEGIGSMRTALVRVADAMNHGISLRRALAAELSELADLFLETDANCLKPRFLNSVGWNVMYFDSIAFLPSWTGSEIERTALRRMLEIWGEGSAIAVVRLADVAAFRRWQPLGFELVRAPELGVIGYACRDLSLPWP
jgi:hypothetical protein